MACDLLAQLPAELTRTVVVLPEVMFNFDRVTLDGVPLADVEAELQRRGARVLVSVPSPAELLATLG